MAVHSPSGALQESFSLAQQQAAAMAGKPPPWPASAPARPQSRRWMGLTVVAAAVAGVAAWWGLGGNDAPATTPAQERATGAHLPAAGRVGMTGANGAAAGHSAVTQAADTPTTAAVVPQSDRTTSALDVTRQSGVIRIASTNAPLGDAVMALARATQTTLRGAGTLAPIAGTAVTVQWQGQDVAGAWDALLGRFANTALSCSSTGCELWIVGVKAAQGTGAAAGHAAPAQPAGAAIRLQSVPQPPPDENTETN